jgi:hypothetical protein
MNKIKIESLLVADCNNQKQGKGRKRSKDCPKPKPGNILISNLMLKF